MVRYNCLPPDVLALPERLNRLTGDGPRRLLLAQLWSTHKRSVLNTLHATFRTRGTWQGRCLQETPEQ